MLPPVGKGRAARLRVFPSLKTRDLFTLGNFISGLDPACESSSIKIKIRSKRPSWNWSAQPSLRSARPSTPNSAIRSSRSDNRVSRVALLTDADRFWCAWGADFAVLCQILPRKSHYFLYFQWVTTNSGSAYRGSNPWGAAKSFQALTVLHLFPKW